MTLAMSRYFSSWPTRSSTQRRICGGSCRTRRRTTRTRSAASASSRGSGAPRASEPTVAAAGTASGRGGKDKKRQGQDRDFFDNGSDWIDDEDAAPGVLD